MVKIRSDRTPLRVSTTKLEKLFDHDSFVFEQANIVEKQVNFTPLYFTEGCKLETVYLVPRAVDLPVCLDCINEGMVQ